MIYFLLILFLLVMTFLESSVVTMPLVLACIVMVAIVVKKEWVFLLAFVFGLLLDIVTFQPIGGSSLFFIVVLGLIFLYQRKYEIQSPIFVGISVFVSTLLYGALFVHRYAFWGALVLGSLVAIIYLFFVLLFQPRRANLLEK